MKTNRFLLFVSLVAFIIVISISACDNRVFQQPDYRIVYMKADPDTIYADNNVTYSTIEVLVKDDENFAVAGEYVTFRTDIGNLIYKIATDSTGVAATTFWDNGDVGIATIEAFIADKSKQVQVVIEETPAIESLELSLNSSELNIDEITTIRATAMNALGNVPNGTLIVFETTRGFFQDAEGNELGGTTQATTTNGQAKVYFNASTQSGTALITVKISDFVETAQITIHPGSPRYLYLYPEMTQVQANSNIDVLISAQVEDRYHNAVESGVGVQFSTTLGSVIEYDNTDSLGFAETIFSPGITAGSAVIEAIADSASASTVITVTSDEVYSIRFAFSGQVEIQVQGTGGQESFEFQVDLYDVNGNLIDYPEEVWFKFINGPEGTNINNQIFMPSTDSLSVFSTNGHAIVSVSSGLVSGTVALKAYAYNSNEQEINAIKTNIVVNAGPPNSVAFSVGEASSGTDMGAGVWQIQCAALLNDIYGNPVDHGTAVWFSLPDDPDWAVIEAAQYVGNENTNGDSLSGVAFTLLNYSGLHTNDTLVLQVETSGSIPGQNFVAQGTVTMPIQYPVIDIAAVPQHLDWVIPGDNDPKDSDIHVSVVDGQSNPINNQEILFSSTLGDPEDGIYTGYTNEAGIVIKTWRFQKYECPAPTAAGPGSTSGTVTAQILGTQTSNNITITLTRYTD